MKNYKILENRPELSSKELTEGMDFAKIKTNATAAAKMTVVKSIIIKTIFGAAIITSGMVVYNNTKVSSAKQEPQQLTVLNDTSKNFSIVEAKPMIDTIKKNSREIIKIDENAKVNVPVQVLKIVAQVDTIKTATAIVPIVSTTKNCFGPIIPKYDSLVNEKNTQSGVVKKQNLSINTTINSFKIWQTSNFCSIPNTQDKYTIKCDGCDYDYVNCKAANSDNLVCVLITLTGNKKSNFKIENKLKNIRLTNVTNNKSETPIMVGIGSDNNFFGSNFKAKKFIVTYNKQMNIYLFFKNAKVGDKIIINNFIEAIIEP